MPNRSFAVYCRECGGALPDSASDWPVFKGSSQAIGVNRFVISARVSELSIEEMGAFQLPDRCKALLMYEDHLFAISQSGEVKIIDVSQEPVKERISFNAGGNIYAVPALHQGSLYVGTEKSLQAYSLGHLFPQAPSARPRWELPLSGTPIRSLVPVENRLFLMLACPDRRHQIHVVNDIQTDPPEPPIKVYAGSHLSSMAGHFMAKSKKIYFLSDEGAGRIKLHFMEHAAGSNPERVSLPLKRPPSEFRKQIPIAVIGAKIFTVFRKEETLYRLDANSGEIDSLICKNVKNFAMASISDPVVINSRGLFLKRMNQQIDLEDGQTIKGSPLVLKDCAVALGMGDGNIRLYDIRNPGSFKICEVSDRPTDQITTMAAVKDIIAAGNDKGVVKIYRLR